MAGRSRWLWEFTWDRGYEQVCMASPAWQPQGCLTSYRELAYPRASVLRETGSTCVVFYNSASAVTWCHCHCTSLMEAVIAFPDSRGEGQRPLPERRAKGCWAIFENYHR